MYRGKIARRQKDAFHARCEDYSRDTPNTMPLNVTRVLAVDTMVLTESKKQKDRAAFEKEAVDTFSNFLSAFGLGLM
jgi:hypothetical protein